MFKVSKSLPDRSPNVQRTKPRPLVAPGGSQKAATGGRAFRSRLPVAPDGEARLPAILRGATTGRGFVGAITGRDHRARLCRRDHRARLCMLQTRYTGGEDPQLE